MIQPNIIVIAFSSAWKSVILLSLLLLLIVVGDGDGDGDGNGDSDDAGVAISDEGSDRDGDDEMRSPSPHDDLPSRTDRFYPIYHPFYCSNRRRMNIFLMLIFIVVSFC
ncbi:unnamed protein product [Onchocerca flexuosa]|uniref:Uncharacterized protein n=1 Tax=Onchocerca flexuosa TaxID=387005 RepID=A0A183H583_9BILA|nr:unnamed protein product [Onchocerca flexuosa]